MGGRQRLCVQSRNCKTRGRNCTPIFTFSVVRILVCSAIAAYNIFTVPYYFAFHNAASISNAHLGFNFCTDGCFILLSAVSLHFKCRRSMKVPGYCSKKRKHAAKVTPVKVVSLSNQNDVQNLQQFSDLDNNWKFMAAIEALAIFPYSILVVNFMDVDFSWQNRLPRVVLLFPLLTG